MLGEERNTKCAHCPSMLYTEGQMRLGLCSRCMPIPVKDAKNLLDWEDSEAKTWRPKP